jgi:hypothetical protein
MTEEQNKAFERFKSGMEKLGYNLTFSAEEAVDTVLKAKAAQSEEQQE